MRAAEWLVQSTPVGSGISADEPGPSEVAL